MLKHRLQLVDKIADVFEFTIDTCKPNVSDLINLAEVVHQHFSDRAAFDFIVVSFVDFLFHGSYDGLNLVFADRAFPTGLRQAGIDFFPIKRLAYLVLFDDFCD